MDRGIAIGWIYTALFFVTFATSASDPGKVCRTMTGEGWKVIQCGPIEQAFDGLVAGALWPLYWTWEAAETVRAQ